MFLQKFNIFSGWKADKIAALYLNMNKKCFNFNDIIYK